MTHGVSLEVFQAAILAAQSTPDPCDERVDLAVAHLRAGAHDSRSVAQAVIASILEEAFA